MGPGILVGINNSRYEGAFHEDKKRGHGATYVILHAFNGVHTNASAHDTGVQKFFDGRIYDGNWMDGLMMGTGMNIFRSLLPSRALVHEIICCLGGIWFKES